MNAVPANDSLPRLRLMRGADRRLQAGHLWIYSNEIDNQATPLRSFSAGQQVAVETEHRKLLGTAYINPNSLLCARLLTRDAEPFGQRQLVSRVRAALQMRERFFAEPFYRLVYGESDLLPGLVVDRFGAHLVVQLNTAGMDAMREQVVAALLEVMQPESILLRNDSGIRELEGLASEVVVAHGEPPEFVELTENGVRFRAPLRTGQKTGWFYDQRPNRAWLRDVAQRPLRTRRVQLHRQLRRAGRCVRRKIGVLRGCIRTGAAAGTGKCGAEQLQG